MRGTSSPHAKLTGDFAKATEAIRIADRFPLRNFAKNSSHYNFGLLQQYLPNASFARRSILMACRCLVQSSTRERNRPAGLKNRNTKSSENAKMSL